MYEMYTYIPMDPVFVPTPNNITVREGGTAMLPCSIQHLGTKRVSNGTAVVVVVVVAVVFVVLLLLFLYSAPLLGVAFPFLSERNLVWIR